MINFKDLNIRFKILIGIGISFIIAMLFLMGIVVYQFRDVLAAGHSLLRKELLERKQVKIKSLVQTRAEMLAQIYQDNQGELSSAKLKKKLAEFNRRADLDNNYFYIYSQRGETICLPPTPSLEGTNRWDLKVKGRYLLREMSRLAQQGGGEITYPYMNPNTGKVETKYGYIEPIRGTNLLVGAGGYESEFHSLLNKINQKITSIRNETIYLLIVGFSLVIVIISTIILRTSNYFTNSINQILAGFNQVVKGNLNFRLTKRTDDEFGELVSGFNYMVGQISNLTYNDPVTELPNINFLQLKLEADLKELVGEDKLLYLFSLGIINFNLITSNYGYETGNKLLKQIFARLKTAIEQKIVIARKDNEFIFYFESDMKQKEILKLAEEMLSQLSEPYNIKQELIYPEFKLGITKSAVDEINCERIIKKSKLALHFVEQSNIDVLFYTPEMKGQLSEKMDLKSKLKEALEKEEFLLHYQPLVDTKQDRIMGLEALVRWERPEEGMISPGQFIPLAEETGLIVDLGTCVLREACRQLTEWQKTRDQELVVSVNIAPQQFQKQDFVQVVKQILEETGLAPEYLQLEITERTVIENVEYTIDTLGKLKDLGIKIAVDDFGTGYSSLEYLNRFAFDSLKIDKAFIQDEQQTEIVKTIIMMGDNLNLSVLAEGVETKEQLQFLKANGCYKYQGYLHSRPMPAEEIIKLL